MEDFYPTPENGRENTVLVQKPKPGDAIMVKKQRNFLHASTEKTSQEEEDSSLSGVNFNILSSELHADFVELIACRLGIVDLLAFRSTCKAWRSASYNASAEIESEAYHTFYASAEIESKAYHTAWFLQYDGPNCLLYDPSQDCDYEIDIPEFDCDVTCIASSGGWLLVCKDGMVFFFCPFSRARIDLPPFPHSELSDHVAVISSSPTSQDCIVGVINHRNSSTLVLNLIRRGSTEWTTYEFLDTLGCLRTITCASHFEGVFYFLDCTKDASVTFSLEEIKWGTCKIIYHEPSNCSPPNTLPFSCNCTPTKTLLPFSHCTTRKPPLFARNSFRRTKIVDKLGFPERLSLSVSICGAKLAGHNRDYYIHNESIYRLGVESCVNYVKVVWIQPRLHHLPPSYSW